VQDAKKRQKIAIWAPSHNFVGLYLPNEGTYQQSEKKLVKQQYFLHMSPRNMLNFSLLAAEIVSLVRGAPANFSGFRVLASLLQQRRSTEANQSLHSVWPLPRLVDYIYTFGGSCSVTEFRQVQNSLCVLHVLCSPVGSVTAWQSSSGREPNFVALSTGRLYLAWQPSRWGLAHILVYLCSLSTWSLR